MFSYSFFLVSISNRSKSLVHSLIGVVVALVVVVVVPALTSSRVPDVSAIDFSASAGVSELWVHGWRSITRMVLLWIACERVVWDRGW